MSSLQTLDSKKSIMWELLNEEMWRLDILPINACEIEEAPNLG